MLTTIRIVSFYALPVLAVALALVAFLLLWRRVRSGALTAGQAIARYAVSLLFPLIAVVALWLIAAWGAAQATGAFAPSPDALVALLPLAAWLELPIVVLMAAFVFVARRAERRAGVGARDPAESRR